MLDVVFIAPSNSQGLYQELSKDYAAIEPPSWACLLAESCRSRGYKVDIIDTGAEKLSLSETVERIVNLNPRLICITVYGQNVNAGTTAMSGAVMLSKFIKKFGIEIPISFVGSHVQALPFDSLKNESSIDIVFTNEGVYALLNLLSKEITPKHLKSVRGIAYQKDGEIFINTPEKLVPKDRMDIDLPGYAWDLLPYDEKPFDLYRCPMWHAEYDHTVRSPYASVFSSLGCQFRCEFCMINIINRSDNDPIGVAGNYNLMRFWSTEHVLKQFDKLVEMGVYNVRIIDEMFLLNPQYYIPLCEGLIERGYGDKLRMWAYSRIDTIRRPGILKLVRAAGIRWLGLGIESGDRNVRLEVSKGKFQDVDIHEVVRQVEAADINVGGNFIFGLPGDTFESMQKTLDLALDLAPAMANFYASMPLPGSQLYYDSLKKGIKLPQSYEAYSWHSYETFPLFNEQLTAAEILKFRDEAYQIFHTSPKFLEKIRQKYGDQAVENIVQNTKIKLKRKLLGD